MEQRIVSHEDWLKERKALLRDEKALTRLKDQLAIRRRALPWVRVEKKYQFDDEDRAVDLGDLLRLY